MHSLAIMSQHGNQWLEAVPAEFHVWFSPTVLLQPSASIQLAASQHLKGAHRKDEETIDKGLEWQDKGKWLYTNRGRFRLDIKSEFSQLEVGF